MFSRVNGSGCIAHVARDMSTQRIADCSALAAEQPRYAESSDDSDSDVPLAKRQKPAVAPAAKKPVVRGRNQAAPKKLAALGIADKASAFAIADTLSLSFSHSLSLSPVYAHVCVCFFLCNTHHWQSNEANMQVLTLQQHA